MNITSTEMAVAIISASGQAYEKMLKEAGVAIRAPYSSTEEGYHIAKFVDESAFYDMPWSELMELFQSDKMPEFVPAVTIICCVSEEEVIVMKNSDSFESEEHLQINDKTDIVRLEKGELFEMLRERRPSLLNV